MDEKEHTEIENYISIFNNFYNSWKPFTERTKSYLLNLKYSSQSLLKASTEDDSAGLKTSLEVIATYFNDWIYFNKQYKLNIDITNKKVDSDSDLESIHQKMTLLLVNSSSQIQKKKIDDLLKKGKQLFDDAKVFKAEIKPFVTYVFANLKKFVTNINTINEQINTVFELLKKLEKTLKKKEIVAQTLEKIIPVDWEKVQDSYEIKKGNYSILMIDDDHYFLEWGKKVLGDYQVQTRDNAVDVVLDVENLPDVILLDMNMPGLSGLEFLMQLKAKYKLDISNLPIIVITALSKEELIKKCLEFGAKYFLTKPVKKEELLLTVNAFLPE